PRGGKDHAGGEAGRVEQVALRLGELLESTRPRVRSLPDAEAVEATIKQVVAELTDRRARAWLPDQAVEQYPERFWGNVSGPRRAPPRAGSGAAYGPGPVPASAARGSAGRRTTGAGASPSPPAESGPSAAAPRRGGRRRRRG